MQNVTENARDYVFFSFPPKVFDAMDYLREHEGWSMRKFVYTLMDTHAKRIGVRSALDEAIAAFEAPQGGGGRERRWSKPKRGGTLHRSTSMQVDADFRAVVDELKRMGLFVSLSGFVAHAILEEALAKGWRPAETVVETDLAEQVVLLEEVGQRALRGGVKVHWAKRQGDRYAALCRRSARWKVVTLDEKRLTCRTCRRMLEKRERREPNWRWRKRGGLWVVKRN